MTRKWISRALAALLCVTLLYAALPQNAARAETALGTGFVNTTKLNMRSGAGTGSGIVATLEKNTAVNVYEVVGTWLRIDVPSISKSGYVSGKYITINSSSLTAYALGVTTGKVNLRKEGTSKSDSLAIVDKNAGVTIYFADKTYGWYKVKVHSTGSEGYISPKYVKIVCKVSDSNVDNKAGVINATNVNFRSGAGTTYSSYGRLQKNEAVTVIGVSGSWYKVTVTSSGKTGYVYATYVTVNGVTPTPTVSGATPSPTPGSGTAGKINAEGVNFRSGPSTTYTSQGKLAKDTAVSILGITGSWYKITVTSTGKTGYVYASYVTPVSGATPTPTPASGAAGKINAASVNFRTGPSTSYKSNGLLGKDTAVTILGVSGDWYKVTVIATGVNGYVFSKYVTVLPATPTPSPTPTPTPTPTPSPAVTTPAVTTPAVTTPAVTTPGV